MGIREKGIVNRKSGFVIWDSDVPSPHPISPTLLVEKRDSSLPLHCVQGFGSE